MKAYVITSFACLLCLATAAGAETSLTMTSDQFDWVGQGLPWSYTETEGTFTATYDTNQDYIHVSLIGPSFSFWWDLYFAAPDGQLLTVGTYNGCARWPFQGAGEPALSVSGNGRGCNILCGEFIVHEVSLGPGDQVNSFWATFTQYCECGTPGLYGDIRFNSTLTPTYASTWGAIKSLYNLQSVGRP